MCDIYVNCQKETQEADKPGAKRKLDDMQDVKEREPKT